MMFIDELRMAEKEWMTVHYEGGGYVGRLMTVSMDCITMSDEADKPCTAVVNVYAITSFIVHPKGKTRMFR